MVAIAKALIGKAFSGVGRPEEVERDALVARPAQGETPALIWRDASAVGVQCVVASDRPRERQRLETALCARVRALASAGAPAPVRAVPIGDPAILAPGAVTLLVHGAVQALAGRRVMAYTIRPFRVSGDQDSVLYGAAPRAVALSAAGEPDSALDTSLRDALADVLPWQVMPASPRALSARN